MPPFPAPPVEGRATRLWLGLGAAGLAVLLCCGGGLAAGIGLVVTGMQALNERAEVAVSEYLDDVRARKFDEAYQRLCPELQARESRTRFAERLSDQPRIASYDPLSLEPITTEIVLPVDVRYVTGTAERLRFRLEQDSSTGEFEVCGIDR